MYGKLRKLWESEETYETDVVVSFFLADSKLLVDDVRIRITYGLEIDIRSWGIKDIVPVLNKVIPIDYLVVDENGTESDQTVDVDLSKLKIEWIGGKQLSLSALSIHLNNDMSVDYGKSYIEMEYIQP